MKRRLNSGCDAVCGRRWTGPDGKYRHMVVLQAGEPRLEGEGMEMEEDSLP